MTFGIIKMLGLVCLYLLLTGIIWVWTRNKQITVGQKLIIGIIYGISSILSTHFGVPFSNMIINIRDVGPLAAGLFFSPTSGLIAGFLGGVERYIAGTYFGIGSYTTIACSISTCLAGFVAMGMNRRMFNGERPSPFYAFFMGAVMEAFHMYVVFITHRGDMRMAFTVVKTCSIPMIFFTALCMMSCSVMLQIFEGSFRNPFKVPADEDISVSNRFQLRLFVITAIVLIVNSGISFFLQTQSARQISGSVIIDTVKQLEVIYFHNYNSLNSENLVQYSIIDPKGLVVKGVNEGRYISEDDYEEYLNHNHQVYDGVFDGAKSLVYCHFIKGDMLIVGALESGDVYWYRNAEAYENLLSDILLFTILYVLIAYLCNSVVVNNILRINKSLGKITNGDLNEVVTVRSSTEFATLSDDINKTVNALKGYINAAEKKYEQELVLARTIQLSTLPQVFSFPDIKEFDLYATIKPAKEVGGDFYDFFFVDKDKLALVIADVSGKGIPAALFMMRSKTAIRSLAESGATPEEIIFKANNTLCDGNDAEMFVTVWIGIINFSTGVMSCANAGHEYPIIKRAGGDYELVKDKHCLAVAAIPNIKAKGYEITLKPGDRIFLYTDGVPEAINESIEQYGTDRILNTLNTIKELSIEQTLNYISSSLHTYKGNAEQFDDITMLGLDFNDYF